MAKSNKFLHNTRGDMNMVNAGIYLVVLLVVLYVGINIIDNVQSASSLSAGDSLYQSQQDLINTTESSYSMAGIMPIVMIAVAVLGGLLSVLYLFSRRD